jgi:hypothetical protein
MGHSSGSESLNMCQGKPVVGGGGWHVSSCINQYSVLTFHFPPLSSTVIGDCMNTPLNSTLGSDVMINTNRHDVIMF